jgi:F-type H+-transporting ATPase subunit gamma
MSNELRDVKRRIQGVRQIHKVTTAMERVASARLARDKARVESSRRFTGCVNAVLAGLLRRVPDTVHPLMHAGATSHTALIVFGGDRGLCGGFNNRLVEAAAAFVGARGPDQVSGMIMGKVMERRLRKHGVAIDLFLAQPSATQSRSILEADIRRITDHVAQGFLQGRFGQAHVLYFKYITTFRQVVTLEPLLPVDRAAMPGVAAATTDVATFEPAPGVILDRLLPEHLYRQLYNAFLHSAASETMARQASMGRASDNARDMLNELNLMYSRMRQEVITNEMIEIAGGLNNG